MEFLHTKLRSSFAWVSPETLTKKNVGLLSLNEQPIDIVFSTRNLTQSLTKTNKTSSNTENKTCLLSTHGISPNRVSNTSNSDPFSYSLSLLPLTICTKHKTAGFLPLDCVRKMPEYTKKIQNYPVLKVTHMFEVCVLEFPNPPPISTPEEQALQHDYMNKCYQCLAKISCRTSAYKYRDYLFCGIDCRLKACATHYWYKKIMKVVEEHNKDTDGSISILLEGGKIFSIDSNL